MKTKPAAPAISKGFRRELVDGKAAKVSYPRSTRDFKRLQTAFAAAYPASY